MCIRDRSKAKEELADINAEIKKDGKTFTAEGWDWRYYADRAKKAKFDLDENQVRPYLQMENVRNGEMCIRDRLCLLDTYINKTPKAASVCDAVEHLDHMIKVCLLSTSAKR